MFCHPQRPIISLSRNQFGYVTECQNDVPTGARNLSNSDPTPCSPRSYAGKIHMKGALGNYMAQFNAGSVAIGWSACQLMALYRH